MSTVDLDDIRERVESHYVGVPPWVAGLDARVLLREVERLRAELDDEKATLAKTFSNFEAFAEDRAFSNDAASSSAVLCLRCCPAVLLGTEEIQRHNEMLHAAGGDSTDG